jgi:2Fe-2S iron-sulfur cluster binding domain
MLPNRTRRLSFVVLACCFLALRQVDGFTSRIRCHGHGGVMIRGSSNSNSEAVEQQESEKRPMSATGASIITVSYEGQKCEIDVFPEETILAALERQSQRLKSQLTALPEMPSDCRRGNCLTCAASCTSNSTQPQNALVVRDGLSPAMSKLVADKGYVLTCSSYVTQSSAGLQLELGENHQLWKEVYASPGRFTTDKAQLAARAAMARVIRKSAERNVEQWARETEDVLRKTEDG